MEKGTLDRGLYKVAVALYEHLATPRAIACHMMASHGEWDQLAKLRVNPAHYMDCPAHAEKFRRDYQATEFLRKSPLLPTSGGEDSKVEAAKVVFHECEERCAETNLFFKLHDLRRGTTQWSLLDARLDDILSSARKIVRRMLGKAPNSLALRFGPGTSYELQGSPYTTVMDKTTVTPHCTDRCSALFEHLQFNTHWGAWRRAADLPPLGITPGNRFTTVEKDAFLRRGICIESLGNLAVQLGLGGEMKRRLGRAGLKVGRSTPYLRPTYRWTPFQVQPPFDGQHWHRVMAREGSMLGGRWATIDLSNASDLVAYELVRRVFPADWFELLRAARSPKTLLDGAWYVLEKFSSMGNGYTFEVLTTLIASLVAACCNLEPGVDVFTYGDDLLVPVAHYDDALAVLKACGLQVNERKSFGTGPFRESCGGDFFDGYNVRPCYADSKLSEPTDWIVLHNQLLERWGSGRFLHRCVQEVPSRLRLFGPRRLGDQCFHGPFTPREKNGIHYVAVVRPTLPRVNIDRWGSMHMTSILMGGVRGSRRGTLYADPQQCQKTTGWVSPRGAPTGYRIRIASVS